MATPPGSAAAATEKFCLEPPPAAAGGAVQSMVAAGVQGVGAGATAGQVGPPPQHAAQMAIGTAKKDGGETPRGGSPAAMPVGGVRQRMTLFWTLRTPLPKLHTTPTRPVGHALI